LVNVAKSVIIQSTFSHDFVGTECVVFSTDLATLYWVTINYPDLQIAAPKLDSRFCLENWNWNSTPSISLERLSR